MAQTIPCDNHPDVAGLFVGSNQQSGDTFSMCAECMATLGLALAPSVLPAEVIFDTLKIPYTTEPAGESAPKRRKRGAQTEEPAPEPPAD